MKSVTVIGAGLAGSEAAWQLAERRVPVTLWEMKPERCTPAHERPDLFAELVCSNSFRGRDLSNAVGLLKEELERGGSLLMSVAAETRVPAGGALAVDRERFARGVTERLRAHSLINPVQHEARELPAEGSVLVATGPLTSESLAAHLQARTEREGLAFYDAIAPIVVGESLEMSELFTGSRYDKGDSADYLNSPLDEDAYYRFIDELLAAQKTSLKICESDSGPRFFPGCLPIEQVAAGGRMAPAFGPMKPVGLVCPRTGRRPFAVVQLRREDVPGSAYNLVGFQTRLVRSEQRRVLRLLPGLGRARFSRYGAVHRNTFLDAPRLLDERLRLVSDPRICFAGQITGVEGYVESIASGFLAGVSVAAELSAREWLAPPPTTALGALLRLTRGTGGRYEPSNIRWDLFPPPARKVRGRRERRRAMADRALADFAGWWHQLR